MLTLDLHRLGHVHHEVGQVSHALVKLGGVGLAVFQLGQRAGLDQLQLVLFVAFRIFHGFQHLLTLPVPQDVRHAHLVEHQVVPAGRTALVAVKTAQVAVQVIGATRTRDHRQVRRYRTEPYLGILLVHRHVHLLADLVRRQHQVALDLVFGQADFGQTVVAHGAGRVAGQAVVDENLRTALQAFGVLDVDRRFFQRRTGRGRKCAGSRNNEGDSGDQLTNSLVHSAPSIR
ncbi:hypothetical protein D3C85_1190790 [compost metagenome]